MGTILNKQSVGQVNVGLNQLYEDYEAKNCWNACIDFRGNDIYVCYSTAPTPSDLDYCDKEVRFIAQDAISMGLYIDISFDPLAGSFVINRMERVEMS